MFKVFTVLLSCLFLVSLKIAAVNAAPPLADEQGSVGGSGSGSGTGNGSGGNPIFRYSHLLPSPVLHPRGTITLGIENSYSLLDELQISTNLLRDVRTVWNVRLKAPLIDFPTFAATATLGFESFYLDQFSKQNPHERITSLQPGLVTAYEIEPELSLLLGGQVNISKQTIPKNLKKSGFFRGSIVSTEFAWAYGAGSSLANNALAFGASYDITYKLFGMGFTHHWKQFSAGVHYFLNADRNKLFPMLNIVTSF